jgi:hypothetical protein
MKISQIIVETSTTSGVVATVSKPLGEVQSRTQVAGLQPAEKVMSGKSKKKGPYSNSISEGKKKVQEADLQEDDIILIPGQGRKSKTGFVPHGKSRVDHEVEMARSDLFSASKNAEKIHAMIKHVSEDEGLEGWVQEKIIKANDYLNTVREYLEGKQIQEMTGGVIAGGPQYEGAKVDRMVKHITKSEKKIGHSAKEAENIAWATANKRGMLDNKNKKAK